MSLRPSADAAAPGRNAQLQPAVHLEYDVRDLAARVLSLQRGAPGGRVLIGIVGEPGSGKSTLARQLAAHLGPIAARAPMDGFHLSNRVLQSLGRRQRKGAPDTFDAAGYVHLLRRLRARAPDTVYAPDFRREVDEPIASSIVLPFESSIVLTEGNYLLLDDEPWRAVRQIVDEVWYVDVDQQARLRWLIARHVAHGMTTAEAEAWAATVDERNAETVRSSRCAADAVIGPDHT